MNVDAGIRRRENISGNRKSPKILKSRVSQQVPRFKGAEFDLLSWNYGNLFLYCRLTGSIRRLRAQCDFGKLYEQYRPHYHVGHQLEPAERAGPRMQKIAVSKHPVDL